MATKIKDTPILFGVDADKFDKTVKENENRKIPLEDYNRAKETYDRIKKNSPTFF